MRTRTSVAIAIVVLLISSSCQPKVNETQILTLTTEALFSDDEFFKESRADFYGRYPSNIPVDTLEAMYSKEAKVYDSIAVAIRHIEMEKNRYDLTGRQSLSIPSALETLKNLQLPIHFVSNSNELIKHRHLNYTLGLSDMHYGDGRAYISYQLDCLDDIYCHGSTIIFARDNDEWIIERIGNAKSCS